MSTTKQLQIQRVSKFSKIDESFLTPLAHAPTHPSSTHTFWSCIFMNGGKPQGFTPPGAMENTWTKRAGVFKGRLVKTPSQSAVVSFGHFYHFCVCENMSERVQTHFKWQIGGFWASWCLSVLHLFTIHPGLNGHGSVQVKGPQTDGGNHFEETRFYHPRIQCWLIASRWSCFVLTKSCNAWPYLAQLFCLLNFKIHVFHHKSRSPGLWKGPKLQPAAMMQ